MKFDVVWENPAYGGANSVFQDQPFSCLLYSEIVFKLCRMVGKRFLQMHICDQKPVLFVPP